MNVAYTIYTNMNILALITSLTIGMLEIRWKLSESSFWGKSQISVGTIDLAHEILSIVAGFFTLY